MNKKIKRIVIGVTSLVVAGSFLTACDWGDKISEPYRDAPRSTVVDSSPVEIIENADGFPNLSTKCNHGNRLYTIYHGDALYGAVTVVAQDPTCPNN